MKKSEKEVNVLNLMAFIGLVIVAVLEIFGLLSNLEILTIKGMLMNLLNTIKNICIMLVIGITAYNFVKDKSKGWLITYIVAISVIFVTTVLAWIL